MALSKNAQSILVYWNTRKCNNTASFANEKMKNKTGNLEI